MLTQVRDFRIFSKNDLHIPKYHESLKYHLKE